MRTPHEERPELASWRRVVGSRWLHGSLAAAAIFTGLVGFAHTEAGRPLLNVLRGAPGCPVDFAALTPERVEDQRVEAVRERAGQNAAASRRVFGFELGRTTRAEVQSVLESHGVSCTASRENSLLRCTEAVQALSLSDAPKIDDLHLQFDENARLVAVDLFREGTSSCAAVAFVRAKRNELEGSLGPVTHSHGELSEDFLDGASLRRAADEYRYLDVVAQVSAMRFGKRGVRVREQYQWVPSGV